MKNKPRIKQRILSLGLALMMLVAAIPMTATAASETYSVEGMNSQSTINLMLHKYALKNDGTVWTWGYTNPTYDIETTLPTRMPMENLRLINGPYQLMANGEVWQVVDDDVEYTTKETLAAYTPKKVMDNVIELAGGSSSLTGDMDGFLALKADGTLLGWGKEVSLFGSGTGHFTAQNAAVLLTDVTHAQGVGDGWVALKNDGTLWAAGSNHRSLFKPNSSDEYIPLTKLMDDVAAFSLNYIHIMVIKKDGSLWSWGENRYGQVGKGSDTSWQKTPLKIMDDVIYAHAGGLSSFAVKSDGTLYGWGNNSSDQLGFPGGDLESDFGICRSTPVVIMGNVAMAMSQYFNTVIVKRDGTLWTAGSNNYGQAGHSKTTYPGKLPGFVKLMDNVALPDGMVGSGTSTSTPVPTSPNGTNTRVPVSDRGTTTFLDADGNIGRLWTSDDYYNGRGTDSLKITVAGYDDNFDILYEKNIPLELYTYAAFYAGEEYFYIVFYQNNLEERSNVEVFRVVKYSKSWERLDAASLYSTNTVRPLSVANYGNVSFAEYNEYLYIHTSQDMYKSSDGKNHQANMTFCVRTTDMSITAERVNVGTGGDGYVSHSLAQDVIVDTSGNIITLDTGDAYPRGAMLYRYPVKAGGNSLDGYGAGLVAKAWTGIGGRSTGAKTTALAETSKGYIYSYWDSGAGSDYIYTRVSNGYIAFTPKDFKKNDTSTIIRPLTSFASTSDESVLSISIIPTSLDGGYIFWQTGIKPGEYGGFTKSYNTYYTTYTADGSLGNRIKLDTDSVKFEAPFYHEGKIILTTSGENGDFYVLKDGVLAKCTSAANAENVENAENAENKQSLTLITPTTATFSDVPSQHWAYSYIETAVSYSLVQGVGDGRYDPERNVSNAEWATMAVNLFYKNDTGRSGDYWWSANMDIAGTQRNIFTGTAVAANGTSNWDAAKVQSGINRYDMAQVIYNIAKEQGWKIPDASAASSQIGDWSSVPANYREAVAYCFSAGLVTGIDSKGTFSGTSTMTRAQAAAVLCRLMDARNVYG